MILTKEFAVDLGSLRWVKPTFFVIGNRCVSVKIAVVLPAVVFSECKILHLISVVLCAVRAVLFFLSSNKWRLVVGRSYGDRYLRF